MDSQSLWRQNYLDEVEKTIKVLREHPTAHSFDPEGLADQIIPPQGYSQKLEKAQQELHEAHACLAIAQQKLAQEESRRASLKKLLLQLQELLKNSSLECSVTKGKLQEAVNNALNYKIQFEAKSKEAERIVLRESEMTDRLAHASAEIHILNARLDERHRELEKAESQMLSLANEQENQRLTAFTEGNRLSEKIDQLHKELLEARKEIESKKQSVAQELETEGQERKKASAQEEQARGQLNNALKEIASLQNAQQRQEAQWHAQEELLYKQIEKETTLSRQLAEELRQSQGQARTPALQERSTQQQKELPNQPSAAPFPKPDIELITQSQISELNRLHQIEIEGLKSDVLQSKLEREKQYELRLQAQEKLEELLCRQELDAKTLELEKAALFIQFDEMLKKTLALAADSLQRLEENRIAAPTDASLSHETAPQESIQILQFNLEELQRQALKLKERGEKEQERLRELAQKQLEMGIAGFTSASEQGIFNESKIIPNSPSSPKTQKDGPPTP